MPTDTSEQGLEALITRAMTGRTHLLEPPHHATSTAVPVSGGTGWLLGVRATTTAASASISCSCRAFWRPPSPQ
jgi:hypothetical protein